jgi:hypothetical protein
VYKNGLAYSQLMLSLLSKAFRAPVVHAISLYVFVWRHDTQPNDISYNDTRIKALGIAISDGSKAQCYKSFYVRHLHVLGS